MTRSETTHRDMTPSLRTYDKLIIDATTPIEPDRRGNYGNQVRDLPEMGGGHQTPTARREPRTQFERNAMATNVICPRCAFDTIEQLHTSPVRGVWDVMQCLYCWRTSEPARRTGRAAYPYDFKMTVEDIVNAPEVPAIPPLLAHRGSRC
jgi:hypothetical protein